MFLQKIQHYLVRKVNDESSLLFDKEAVSSAPEKARKKKNCGVFITWPLYKNITETKTLGREKKP